MNTRIANMLQSILCKKHHDLRKELDVNIAASFAEQDLPPVRRVSKRLALVLENETPVILEGERILFTRTVRKLPALFTEAEWDDIKSKHYIHELGQVCNITPNYASVIRAGLEEIRQGAEKRLDQCRQQNDVSGQDFLEALIETIDAVEGLAERYRQEAMETGKKELADILERVPKYGARTFHEALQFFRILHFVLWCEGEYHNTIGRFDQFMYSYLERDIREGRLTEDSAFELLEEFFLTFNKDSDLYPGVQQGDNGQSMVLGGIDLSGQDAFNLLSKMCLLASRELKLIDPKINLRVSKDTPQEIYELGTELTKEGLGFPQYSNDDIIIPGLVKKGYSDEDAKDYSVAACWETIIPGYGMDIPNIDALSYPKVVDECLHESLADCSTYDDFVVAVKKKIDIECKRLASNIKNLWMIPAPFMSVMMNGCVDNARDISVGGKYNNFGFHGTGLATAADSLAAIKKYVFEEKRLTAPQLNDAVDTDFEGYDDLLYTLRNEAPKMGSNDDYVDSIAVMLLDAFADALEGLRNERGGIYRAGTGSAMYYLWHVKELGASPDGRKKGEPLGANYSPSLFAKIKGPISVIESFTKPHLIRVINGGPLTLEFHETLFKDDESKKKVAMLVASFIKLGGSQLQLNAVDRETLLDAKLHPESHKNLIVRVWGWSAYFVELDKEYQDHVISRREY